MDIFSLVGSIVLKDDGVTQGLDKIDKKAQETDKSMSGHFKNIADVAGRVRDALGAVGLIAGTFLVSAVESASKASIATDQLKTKIENQGISWTKAKGQVDTFTKGITSMSIYTAGDAKTALDNLITKHVSLASALKDASGMTELAAAKHITLKEASDTVADAENGRMKGLVKLGIVTADEVKQGISMEEINKRLNTSYQGLSEGQMKTLPGVIAIISRNFASLKVGIGTALLPVITKFGTALGNLSNYLTNVSPEAKKIIAIVLSLTTGIGLLAGGVGIATKVMGVLGPVVGGLGSLIGGLSLPLVAIIAGIALLTVAFVNNWGGIRTKTEEFMAFIKPILIDGFNAVVSWVKENLPIIEAKFKEVMQGVKTIYETILKPVLTFMIASLLQVVNWVKANFPLIKATIETVMNAVKAVITVILNGIKAFWDTWGKTILDFVTTIFNTIKTVISTAIHVVEDVLKAVMQLITGDWSGAWKSIVQAVKDLFGGIGKVIGTILDGAKKLFVDFATNAINLGKGMIQGIIDGVVQKGKDLINGVKDLVDLVIKKFKEGFGIHSPSTVMAEMGGHLIQGLMNGMGGKDLKGFASKMVGSLKGAFSSGMSGNVTDWLTTAMAITGTSMSDMPMLQALIMHESGGNPNAINLTDSNAQAGHPSQGLMQTIPSTFARWKLPGFDGITNPISNIIAGIRYIKGTYGSVANTPGIKSLMGGGAYKGYARGTQNASSGLAWVGENGRELLNFNGGESVTTAEDSAKLASNSSESKQPITIQLILQNGKAIAEFLIDDIDKLIGSNNKIVGRSVGV